LFAFQSIESYHSDLLQGNTTCVEAVTHYLTQITAQEHLNAFVKVYADEALEKAKLLDDKRNANAQLIGIMHGVVIGIKDVIAYKNHPVSAASKMLKGFTSIYNATVVEKLLAAEAIIIGHQNCDEFAMGSSNENSYYGVVKNALNENHVPGGSSGGSAVAVQADLCMISIGSDTGGSVRQPADYCGLVGLKPSYGRVSRYGLIAYASSFDQIGILSKTVKDASLVLEIISGKDEYDTTLFTDAFSPLQEDIKNKKIAYFKDAIEHPSLDVEIKNHFLLKVEALKQQGHEVTEIDFSLIDYLVPSYYVLTTAEASSNLNRYDGVKFGYRTQNTYKDLTEFYKLNRSEGFGKEVQRRIMLGSFVLSSGYYDAYYTKAQQVRQLLVNFIEKTFETFDFIIMPTVPETAPKIGDKDNDPIKVYLADIYTVLANLTGIPAISIPLATHGNGLPFGLQIMAKHKEEAAILHFAHDQSNN
jgi:aspartyl-tRNA(Asn)/glutamyl-tRNA(Gln) amidotransferase subunit A